MADRCSTDWQNRSGYGSGLSECNEIPTRYQRDLDEISKRFRKDDRGERAFPRLPVALRCPTENRQTQKSRSPLLPARSRPDFRFANLLSANSSRSLDIPAASPRSRSAKRFSDPRAPQIGSCSAGEAIPIRRRCIPGITGLPRRAEKRTADNVAYRGGESERRGASRDSYRGACRRWQYRESVEFPMDTRTRDDGPCDSADASVYREEEDRSSGWRAWVESRGRG